jgi:hypothetical protein
MVKIYGADIYGKHFASRPDEARLEGLEEARQRPAELEDEKKRELEGIPLAKAAESLEKAVLRFEKRLDDFLGGRGPGIQELEELLKSPQAKAHLALPGLKHHQPKNIRRNP